VETNVEYPTDTRLLFDALRKAIELVMQLCPTVGMLDWQGGQEEIRKVKHLLRQVQRLKHSSAKAEGKKKAREKAIIAAHEDYLRVARDLLQHLEKTVQEIQQKHRGSKDKLLKIEEFINHAQRQI
jgi:vacuolar-type H+-ATPase subunit I/STV1